MKFSEKWEKERQAGFKAYYKRHWIGILSICLGIFIASIISKKTINIAYLIISIVVVIPFPAMSWCMNEFRFKKKK